MSTYGDSRTFSGNLLQSLTTFQVNQNFLVFRWNFTIVEFVSMASCPVSGCYWVYFLLLSLPTYMMGWIDMLIRSTTFPSLHGWRVPNSVYLKIFQCLELIFVVLCSSKSISFLYYNLPRRKLKVFLRGLSVSNFLNDSNSVDFEELELGHVFWVRSRSTSIEKKHKLRALIVFLFVEVQLWKCYRKRTPQWESFVN